MAIRVYIDQGHNPAGVNAGAEGFGVREQDITYQVGQFLYNILTEDYRFSAKLSRRRHRLWTDCDSRRPVRKWQTAFR